MSAANSRRTLLAALVLLALTALVLHYLAHPILLPDKDHPGQTVFRGSLVAATLLPLVDLVVVTGLFLARRTAPLAYLLNGVLVIYGTVLMGHYGIVGLTSAAAQGHWIFRSMLIDVALVWVDFLVGKALYESWMREA
jgi:uncharacterized membrane protein YdjX (TVP38/TMEM64 family)